MATHKNFNPKDLVDLKHFVKQTSYVTLLLL